MMSPGYGNGPRAMNGAYFDHQPQEWHNDPYHQAQHYGAGHHSTSSKDRKYTPDGGAPRRSGGKGRGKGGARSGGKGGKAFAQNQGQGKGSSWDRGGQGKGAKGANSGGSGSGAGGVKWRPCKYFNMGHCRNGDKCKFVHAGAPPNVPQQSYHHEAAPYGEPNQEVPRNSSRGDSGWGGQVPYELELSAILGNVVPMARNQRGSRVLQEAIDAQVPGDYVLIDSIYVELLEHFVPLMTDLYGNYVCQKLLRKCRPVQVHAIVNHIKAEVVELSQDPHGTRAMQCLVQTLAMHPHYVADVQTIIAALQKNAIALIHSMHGNHVIQSCLTNFSCTANEFVHQTILEYFVHVANNRYGCCVLQCCLKTGNFDQYTALLEKLCENTLVLVKDAYGNYAVQFILDRGDPAMYLKMFREMEGHIAQLSMQKFSSNVIEKGLRCEPQYAGCAMLILSELAQTDKTKALLHSPYGNYVIQKALAVQCEATVQLAAAIRPHLPALRSIPYGKKLEKLVREAYVHSGHPMIGPDFFLEDQDGSWLNPVTPFDSFADGVGHAHGTSFGLPAQMSLGLPLDVAYTQPLQSVLPPTSGLPVLAGPGPSGYVAPLPCGYDAYELGESLLSLDDSITPELERVVNSTLKGLIID